MLAVGGENLIDLVQIDMVDGMPRYQAIPGGSPFNLAIAAGRQGLAVRYLTPVSTDASGVLLARRLLDSNVDIAAPRLEAPSSLAMVTLQDGSPHYSFYRQDTAERYITLDMLEEIQDDKMRIFHLGSLALAAGEDAVVWEQFASDAVAKGIIFSLDPNVRPSLIDDENSYRQRLIRLMAQAQILKLSDEDLVWLSGYENEQSALAWLTSHTQAPVLVLTKGDAGCLINHAGEWHPLPAKDVDDFKDTVGAGDTFMASLIVWLVEHDQIDQLDKLSQDQKKQMAEYAATAAALNCAYHGCNPPHRSEINL